MSWLGLSSVVRDRGSLGGSSGIGVVIISAIEEVGLLPV